MHALLGSMCMFILLSMHFWKKKKRRKRRRKFSGQCMCGGLLWDDLVLMEGLGEAACCAVETMSSQACLLQEGGGGGRRRKGGHSPVSLLQHAFSSPSMARAFPIYPYLIHPFIDLPFLHGGLCIHPPFHGGGVDNDMGGGWSLVPMPGVAACREAFHSSLWHLGGWWVVGRWPCSIHVYVPCMTWQHLSFLFLCLPASSPSPFSACQIHIFSPNFLNGYTI